VHEDFYHTWHRLSTPGFFLATPWRARDLKLALDAPAIESCTDAAGSLPTFRTDMSDGMTEPPLHLMESELVAAMERHGIGTDASMSTHIQTICDRRYVQVCDEEGKPLDEANGEGGTSVRLGTNIRCGTNRSRNDGVRRTKDSDGGHRRRSMRLMVPLDLGRCLIEALLSVDESLVKPGVRRRMEAELSAIATGKAQSSKVVDATLGIFLHKYVATERGIDAIRSKFSYDSKLSSVAEEKPLHVSGPGHDAWAAGGAIPVPSQSKKRLSDMTDSEMRRAEELADVQSAFAAHSERVRREKDRHKARQAASSTLVGSLFDFASVSVGHRRPENFRSPTGAASACSNIALCGAVGRDLQYRARLERLWRIGEMQANAGKEG
jgi:hypothetical protein